MSQPLLSIIIASYNSEGHIGACFESLRREWDSRLEVILIDGASTDTTIRIAESYDDVISNWVSEPDNGQSEAFNKGFSRASGKYLTWLNSDDVLCSGAISKIMPILERSKAEWLTANCLYIDDEDRVLRCCRSGGFESFAMNFGLLNVFGPSSFFTPQLYRRIGKFREDFHFCMDTEYWWRIAVSGVKYDRVPIYFWALRLHQAAKTASAITGDFEKRPRRMQEEGTLIREMYYPRQNTLSLRLGVVLVRLYRLLNGSYLRALIDTRQARGASYTILDA